GPDPRNFNQRVSLGRNDLLIRTFLNILTNEKVFKAGLKRKMRKAAMDRNYLASVLAGSGLS
ncbi:hypothetical protein V7O29_21170, partial [Escherichia coli]